ncbi:MAG: hypothetical protein HYS12_16955 [Planctomycetes bacterium]|nr:hypothetical protein [Planctomycetota bacterium]
MSNCPTCGERELAPGLCLRCENPDHPGSPRLVTRAFGLALMGLGWPMAVLAGCGLILFFRKGPHFSEAPLLWIGAFVIGGIGMALQGAGRKMFAARAVEQIRGDTRPPTLLLRSFADDEMIVPGQSPLKGGIYMAPLGGMDETLEQQTARVFSAVGPVIAIGRPGERLPPLGFGRMWVRHDRWKQVVQRLLAECQRVIMFLGDLKGRDGLEWEVDQVFTHCRPEQVILIVPPVGETGVQSRWRKYRERLGERLPDYLPNAAAVTFGEGWHAEVLFATRGLAHGRDDFTYEKVLKDALRRSELRIGLSRAMEDENTRMGRPRDDRPSQSGEPARPPGLGFPISECPQCEMRVLPMADGVCPSCRKHRWEPLN